MRTELVTEISNYIRSNQNTPFEWGKFDCCVFIAGAIEIITGLDLYAKYRGGYESELGAAKIQKTVGTIEDTLDSHFERVGALQMRRGDVGMLESGIMFLYFGGSKWAASKNGVAMINEKVKHVWRVE